MPAANEMNKAEFDKLQKKLAREKWEIMFAGQLETKGWQFIREYQFHPTRKWRFDFVITNKFTDQQALEMFLERAPELAALWMFAVEIEGGTWSRGRHTRGSGFAEDCRKYNAAAAMGWRVFRFPAGMVEDGSAIKFLEEEVFYKQ